MGKGFNSIGGLQGVSYSDKSTGSTESSSSSTNFLASFSRRDFGESTGKTPFTYSIDSQSRDESAMEFAALAIWTENVSFPKWTSILP